MRVVGISGSPREGGNTEIMVKEALEGARQSGAEVEFVGLAGKRIGGCEACAECGKGGRCVIEDDMQPIFPRLVGADVVVIGSPIYFGMVSAQTKALLDRTYFLSKSGRKLEGKVGAVITVGGRAGHELSAAYLMDFMTLQGMILPGRAFAQSYSRELGAAAKEEKALRDARSLGERTVKLALKLAGPERKAEAKLP
ncbi:MAG: flavodoxin family protein [Methanomassiliicoccales archaeon]|jgi:multimeric flavodoxin WrbA|nr:flavodoxin family protein [Methanomassiliicoccales archaeon]